MTGEKDKDRDLLDDEKKAAEAQTRTGADRDKDKREKDPPTKEAQPSTSAHVTQAEADLESARNLRDFSAEFDDDFDAAAVLEEIEDGEEVEIAFVDDHGFELPLAPRIVASNDAWALGSGGESLVYQPAGDIELSAPVAGERSLTLGGYALVIDGEHVATTYRDDPLRMGAGMTFDLSRDIAFR